MKRPILAIAGLLLISCATDEPGPVQSALNYEKSALAQAANSANPYDGAGALRNVLLSRVAGTLPKDADPAQVLEAVLAAAEAEPDFQTLKTPFYSALTLPELEGFILRSPTAQQAAAALSLTAAHRADLETFIEGLLALSDGDFESSYDYIVAFESHVLGSVSYTEAEKQVVLTLTSLERYGAYYRKKPKDKDWDLLITGIMANAQGAGYDRATAVVYSVALEAVLHL